MNLSAAVVPPLFPQINLPSLNILRNVTMRSFGLNSCGCNDPAVGCDAVSLASINFAVLQLSNSHMFDWGHLRNPVNCGNCLNHTYHTPPTTVISDPPNTFEIWRCNSHGNNCYLDERNNMVGNFWPLCEEYYNPVHPGRVNLYPDQTTCDNYRHGLDYEALPYSVCAETWPRLRNPKESGKIKSLLAFPNPSAESIKVHNAITGEFLYIYSPLGELLFSKKVTDTTFDIDLKEFKSGVFIIRTDYSDAIKFVKL